MKPIIRNKHGRRGSAVVEAAVMAPLVVTAMFGMIEVGYCFMIRQTVTLAAREGCRAAALPGGTMAEVNAAVADTMDGPRLTGYTVTSNLTTMEDTDTDVWVKVSIPFDRASFTGHLLGGGMFDVASETHMRREGVDSGS